ncbi:MULTISPECIES: nuclear transport factor 2 family protein [Enterococcus]|uniref:SnoaL-like domain-containing protein n=1 Tax=Enterococcus sulfureus ATCC 49903 TaxID=1140003 RepID=S0L4R7_9ENTE|nr:nuclear transport factor 2 family protein [Enterococcus sulfureus]EOT46501.1 hypothetical protein OMY_01650 [Enterococcus sulfureus ATCC 49903]EOT86186.1 hypothetical protein I573_00939 [Enterococcus sulfureus ATCC 49903]
MNKLILDDYFARFDDARQGAAQKEALHELFSEELVFVLNGQEIKGKSNWRAFIDKVYQSNEQLVHMYNGWEQQEDGTYQTRWAICGKRFETGVYTEEGMDIARLDDQGKIVYLENVPDNTAFFS